MKIGFLFSGQGSQYVGMGKSFHDASASVRELFERAEENLSMPLRKYMFEGPEETLTRTDITQPAVCAVSLAALRLIREANVAGVAASCGHSLGEYAALVSAGALDEMAALSVIRQRGMAMQAAADAAPGKMAAVVGLGMDAARQSIAAIAGVQIAAQNAPDQIVLSGESAAVDAAVDRVKTAGAKNAVVLKTSGAWHSHLMEAAKPALRAALENAQTNPLRLPVISNATADAFPAGDPPALRDLLVMQLTSPIRFVECLQKMRAMGVTIYVELGPGKVLRGLVKKLDRSLAVHHVEDMPSLEEFLKAISISKN